MADNNNDDLRHRMEVQGQASRTQQESLDIIQHMLSKILTNRNNQETSGKHDREEENLNKETLENKHSKESSSIDAKVIKDIQAQIASLTQRDELKKVGMS